MSVNTSIIGIYVNIKLLDWTTALGSLFTRELLARGIKCTMGAVCKLGKDKRAQSRDKISEHKADFSECKRKE